MVATYNFGSVYTKTKCIKLIFIGKITLVPVAFLMALSIVFGYLYVRWILPRFLDKKKVN